MPISGSFGRMQATQQPYTGTPNLLPEGPAAAHSVANPNGPGGAGPHQTFIGDNAGPFGGGLNAAQGVDPRMAANGIMRDLSRYTDMPSSMGNGYAPSGQASSLPLGPAGLPNGYTGGSPASLHPAGRDINAVNHAATAVTRRGMAIDWSDTNTKGHCYDQQGRMGAAHADMSTARIAGHEYSPIQGDFAGQRVHADIAPIIPHSGPISGRTIAKSQNGGEFVDGPKDDFVATFFDKAGAGRSRRMMVPSYSSPAIGAYYSRHTLRGVLPNTIQTPYPQLGIAGGATNKNAGIPPNARNLPLSFTVPQLFRMPVNMSDNITVINDGTVPSASLGMGFE